MYTLLVVILIMNISFTEISIGFNQTSYTVAVGRVTDMCIFASGKLNRDLVVNLSVNREGLHEGTDGRYVCLKYVSELFVTVV